LGTASATKRRRSRALGRGVGDEEGVEQESAKTRQLEGGVFWFGWLIFNV
jgi:hypothetical protein